MFSQTVFSHFLPSRGLSLPPKRRRASSTFSIRSSGRQANSDWPPSLLRMRVMIMANAPPLTGWSLAWGRITTRESVLEKTSKFLLTMYFEWVVREDPFFCSVVPSAKVFLSSKSPWNTCSSCHEQHVVARCTQVVARRLGQLQQPAPRDVEERQVDGPKPHSVLHGTM